ncbi:MAG: 50S ribosomal protein L29 [Patescibacteria group bacterium]|nr:50S ribosomal protein L29 [Patescibacteria group bacterium]
MKVKELRMKQDKELVKTIGTLREKLRVLRFELAAGKVKDVRAIRQNRKDIAKILTILKEKKHE